jgi:hypothetical protein
MTIKRGLMLGLWALAVGVLTSAATAAPPLPKGLALKQATARQHSSLNAAAVAASADPLGPTFTRLTNQLPDGINFTMLLTDGTVLAQDATYNYMWWKLTPDINGSYANGTWTQLASLPVTYSPLATRPPLCCRTADFCSVTSLRSRTVRWTPTL